MIPAFARAEESKPPLRMVFMYVPNGIMMNDWTPAKEGADYDFTRILKPLEPSVMTYWSYQAYRSMRETLRSRATTPEQASPI